MLVYVCGVNMGMNSFSARCHQAQMCVAQMCVEQNLSKSLGYDKGIPYSGGPEAQDQGTERFHVC